MSALRRQVHEESGLGRQPGRGRPFLRQAATCGDDGAPRIGHEPACQMPVPRAGDAVALRVLEDRSETDGTGATHPQIQDSAERQVRLHPLAALVLGAAAALDCALAGEFGPDRADGRAMMLVEAGALADARDRAGKTTPLLVTPTGESPCRILLPSSGELSLLIPPGQERSELGQVDTAHLDRSDILVPHSDILDSSLTHKELTPLGGLDVGGDKPPPGLRGCQFHPKAPARGCWKCEASL